MTTREVKNILKTICLDYQGNVIKYGDCDQKIGVRLKDISFKLLFEMVFGSEAKNFQKDSIGFKCAVAEYNALDHLLLYLPDGEERTILSNGYNSMVKVMAEKFKKDGG